MERKLAIMHRRARAQKSSITLVTITTAQSMGQHGPMRRLL